MSDDQRRTKVMEALHSICTEPVDHTFGLECVSPQNHAQQADRVLAVLFPAVADCGVCPTSTVIHMQHRCPVHDSDDAWD